MYLVFSGSVISKIGLPFVLNLCAVSSSVDVDTNVLSLYIAPVVERILLSLSLKFLCSARYTTVGLSVNDAMKFMEKNFTYLI